ncbi:MAG: cold shock domain-containing protein [Candidatus Acidiferrales bacterium]
MEGYVSRYWVERQYGFLMTETGDVFFHAMNAEVPQGGFQRGDKVSYEEGQFNGKKTACSVKRIGGGRA